MDEHIVASQGMYLDRNDFVGEAIWDRLNEDAVASDGAPSALRPTTRTSSDGRTVTEAAKPSPVPTGSVADQITTSTLPAAVDQSVSVKDNALLDTLRTAAEQAESTPTLDRRPMPGINFGLHNRDLPTLWVTAELAAQVREEGQPVPWVTFVQRLRSAAQRAGEDLRHLDRLSGTGVKVAIGFPKPGDKARNSEDRLVSTALGGPTRAGVTGPAFLLGLVAADDPTAPRPAVAPTPEALRLLSDLLARGLVTALPHPDDVTIRWMEHVAACAPEEHAAWMAVLTAVRGNPSRLELVSMFPEWEGSRADTNCTGYVSRGREWGLVTPELFDGRYSLTTLGEHILHGRAAK